MATLVCVPPALLLPTRPDSYPRHSCTYDELATGQPCRSVALANTDSGDNKVTVLVACVTRHCKRSRHALTSPHSPRRLKHMRKIYAGHDRVVVIPLSLRSSDISPSLLLRVFENEVRPVNHRTTHVS